MRIAFFTPVTLPTAPIVKRMDLEEEESMSETSSHYTEGDSTSIEELSEHAFAEGTETATPLPEIDNKDLMNMLLSPLEPECDF